MVIGSLPVDAHERQALCDLLEDLGPDAATLLEGWTSRHVAAHLVLRERSPIVGPGMVFSGPYQRYAERRTDALAQNADFGWLVRRLRSGPPPGFFRLKWVRSFPNLNEFFIHQEDVRRANSMAARDNLAPALEAALWVNACRGSRYLSRRLSMGGLDLEWEDTGERITVRKGEPVARLVGAPGELLLYLFGRAGAAEVTVTGTATALKTVQATHFGM